MYHIPACNILVCALVSSLSLQAAAENQTLLCKNVYASDFATCGSKEGEQKRLSSRDENRVDGMAMAIRSTAGCEYAYKNVCRRLFNVGRLHLLDFGDKISVEVSQMLRGCCGNCTKYHEAKLQPPFHEVSQSVVDKLDIVYPLYSPTSEGHLQGRYFIPVLKIPGAYYVTLEKTKVEMAMYIIDDCLEAWPLLMMGFLFSLIAGFFIWIIDTWWNVEEFPRSFLDGFYQGFWWSFVSMTTVGYGDKTPKSLPARMFAVFWILVGITVTTVYIATLSANIMTDKTEEAANMNGMKVGALKDRIYDSAMIAEHGGILHEIEFTDVASGMVRLIERLKAKEIDGFLVTKPTFYYFTQLKKEQSNYGSAIREVKLMKAMKTWNGDGMVAGMLLKNKDDYLFFKEYFHTNWAHIQSCYAYDLNYKGKEKKEKINHLRALFVPFFIGAMVILVFIFIFGGVFEYRQRKRGVERGNTNSSTTSSGFNGPNMSYQQHEI